jgi:hypothetical protein
MSKPEITQLPVVPEEGVTPDQVAEPEVTAELHIRVLSNGGIQLNVPEGAQELEPIQIESLTRTVSDQLRDTRVAQQAVEMFKARLG